MSPEDAKAAGAEPVKGDEGPKKKGKKAPEYTDEQMVDAAEGRDGVYIVPVNRTDPEKVKKIAASMEEHGWQGPPLLVFKDEAITGSHRLAAAKRIEATK